MRVFVGGIITETNTFSPIPTGMDDFAICRDSNENSPCESQIMGALKTLTETRQWTFCPSFVALAEPGGTTTRKTYETLRDSLLGELESQLPVDMVILPLHGAMVADGYHDCEGDLISRVRKIVGKETPIGVELDLHCHLTKTMVNKADLIAIYKEYPHTDIIKRAEELFQMLVDMVQGKTRPVMAMHDCRMINLFPTPLEPMRTIVDGLQQIEQRAGIISADIAHGFPWGDVPDCGTRTLVITDNNQQLAENTAREIAETLINQRHELLLRPLSLDEALDQALNHSSSAPVIIADQSDNAGGGAPSDSTFALAELLERKAKNCAIGMIWDPFVVENAKKAGAGSSLSVRLGGKAAITSGKPLDLKVRVVQIIENFVQPFPQDNADPIPSPCGDTVCLECDGIYIIVNSIRTQVFHPDVFTDFGLVLKKLNVIIVKSIFHFYAGFAPVSDNILMMGAPGCLNARFTEIPYLHADLNKFPWIDPPHY